VHVTRRTSSSAAVRTGYTSSTHIHTRPHHSSLGAIRSGQATSLRTHTRTRSTHEVSTYNVRRTKSIGDPCTVVRGRVRHIRRHLYHSSCLRHRVSPSGLFAVAKEMSSTETREQQQSSEDGGWPGTGGRRRSANRGSEVGGQASMAPTLDKVRSAGAPMETASEAALQKWRRRR